MSEHDAERRWLADERARLEHELVASERRRVEALAEQARIERELCGIVEAENKARAAEIAEKRMQAACDVSGPAQRELEPGRAAWADIKNVFARRDVMITVVAGGSVVILCAFLLALAAGFFVGTGDVEAALMVFGVFVGSGGLMVAIVHKSTAGIVATTTVSATAISQAIWTSGGGVAVVAAGLAVGGLAVGDALEEYAEDLSEAEYARYRWLPYAERVRRGREDKRAGTVRARTKNGGGEVPRPPECGSHERFDARAQECRCELLTG